MLNRIVYSFAIAAESMSRNKIRAILTSLGIVFGVASVISMLAIGTGAQREILEQLRILGTNNIIIEPIIEQKEGEVKPDDEETEEEEKRPFSPGLTLADARSIETFIPSVASVSPEVEVETTTIRAGLRRTTKLVGVASPYFQDSGFELAEGTFFGQHHINGAVPVCIIGHDIRTRFFAMEEPLGNRIKCGNLWMTVIGVLKERNISSATLEHLGIRNFNFDIYTPITTLLMRYENRAQLTEQDIRTAERQRARGTQEEGNYHQLDRLVIRVDGSKYVTPVAEVISRMLQRRHLGVVDYQIKIPEVLLAQERRTQAIFNVVLAAIASISLIVGGIGIMNIMLASVLERIKEIGIRRSLGATARDVVLQFLIEAMTLSFTGGGLGILLGIGLSLGIEKSTGISTIITIPSILLAFLVSAGVGLAFGILPARRAAQLDPVEALRHE